MESNIIVAIIGGCVTLIGYNIKSSRKSKSDAIREATREQEQKDRFDAIDRRLDIIDKKLDEHNHYAEKLGDISISLIGMKKDIEYLKKG